LFLDSIPRYRPDTDCVGEQRQIQDTCARRCICGTRVPVSYLY
jgi:hypothetical protein